MFTQHSAVDALKYSSETKRISSTIYGLFIHLGISNKQRQNRKLVCTRDCDIFSVLQITQTGQGIDSEDSWNQ